MCKKNIYFMTLICLFLVTHPPAFAQNTGDILWIYETGGPIYSSPVFGADGTIYVGSNDHCLHAINPDGTGKWIYATEDAIFSSPSVAADGTIYVGSDDWKLHAVNPNGTFKWAYTTEGLVQSSPAIGSDGVIYVGGYDNYVYGINPDGSLKWRYLTDGDIKSSPAIAEDGTLYIGTGKGSLYAITSSSKNAVVKWSFETASDITYSSPALSQDGTIYVGGTDGYLYAINPDGTEKWRFPAEVVESSPAVGADGTIYIGSWNERLYAVNPDGTERWNYKANGGIFSSPAIGAGKTIYIGGEDKQLYAVKTDSNPKWTNLTLGGAVYSSPAVDADGDIYVGCEDGYLYAVKGDFSWQYGEYVSPSQGYADSHWPKFRQNNLNLGRRPAYKLIFPELPQWSYLNETSSVPITLMNLNLEGIREIYGSVSFDPNIIEVTDIILAEPLQENGYRLDKTVANETGELTMKITSTSETYYASQDEEVIAEIQYHGKVESASGNLDFTTAKVNGFFISSESGSIEIVPRYDISGNVTYLESPLPDVTLTLTDEDGKIYGTAKTDSQGDYQITDIPEGNYTLTPFKTGDIKGLSSSDASRILRYALGQEIQLSCYHKIASDVNRDKIISTTGKDAAKVAECSANYDLGIECKLNGGPDTEEIGWIFTAEPIEICEEWPISYSDTRTLTINSDMTEQNFIGVKLGELTGNWIGTQAETEETAREIQPEVEIQTYPESSLNIPISLEPGTEPVSVEGMDMVIQFDENVLTMTDVTLTQGSLAGWEDYLQVIPKEGEGLAAIRIYGSEVAEITEKSDIAFLNFTVTGPADSETMISFIKFERNEAEANGGFRMNDVTGTQAKVVINYKYLMGDIDHSKVIDLKDALLVLKILAGLPVEDTIYLDTKVNGDGNLGIEELIYILQEITK